MAEARVHWISADDPPDHFPDPGDALDEPDGLLAAGGDLGSARILAAYRQGVFPWYEEGQPVLWWSPDPRCVLPAGALHVSRRTRRALARSGFEVDFNRRFDEVIDACAAPRAGQRGTWITGAMRKAYRELHAAGWAHSIEILEDGRLVGGLYGLAIGQIFFGESMFSGADNASKAAMLAVCKITAAAGFPLMDCQVASRHLLSMGATLMPRPTFLEIVRRETDPAVRFSAWPTRPGGVEMLLD